MSQYRLTVPPQPDMDGYCTALARYPACPLALSALALYNSHRAQFGLKPVSSMPIGTKYEVMK